MKEDATTRLQLRSMVRPLVLVLEHKHPTVYLHVQAHDEQQWNELVDSVSRRARGEYRPLPQLLPLAGLARGALAPPHLPAAPSPLEGETAEWQKAGAQPPGPL